MIDAYLHLGGPRFGSAELALREMDRHGIDRGILVLSPTSADFAAVRAARKLRGVRVRMVGNPYGETDAERSELIAWQIALGITALRLMPHDVAANQKGLELMGEAGRWLFAINPYDHPEVLESLLAWLEKYPSGRIAMPHCLKPIPFDQLPAPETFRKFLAHPRVFPILSRQGGTGTKESYPHADLRPWVDDVFETAGAEKILWASEYPVLIYRDETLTQAIDWIRELIPELSDSDYKAFTEGNAARIFFDEAAPEDRAGPIPEWFQPDIRNGWSPPYAQRGIKISPDAAEVLLKEYLDQLDPAEPITYSEFLSKWIDSKL